MQCRTRGNCCLSAREQDIHRDPRSSMKRMKDGSDSGWLLASNTAHHLRQLLPQHVGTGYLRGETIADIMSARWQWQRVASGRAGHPSGRVLAAAAGGAGVRLRHGRRRVAAAVGEGLQDPRGARPCAAPCLRRGSAKPSHGGLAPACASSRPGTPRHQGERWSADQAAGDVHPVALHSLTSISVAGPGIVCRDVIVVTISIVVIYAFSATCVQFGYHVSTRVKALAA